MVLSQKVANSPNPQSILVVSFSCLNRFPLVNLQINFPQNNNLPTTSKKKYFFLSFSVYSIMMCLLSHEQRRGLSLPILVRIINQNIHGIINF
jgi:hypothetical protein